MKFNKNNSSDSPKSINSDISLGTNLKVFNGIEYDNSDNFMKSIIKSNPKINILSNLSQNDKNQALNILSFGDSESFSKVLNINISGNSSDNKSNSSVNDGGISKSNSSSSHSKKSKQRLSINEPEGNIYINSFVTTEGISNLEDALAYRESKGKDYQSETVFTKIHKEISEIEDESNVNIFQKVPDEIHSISKKSNIGNILYKSDNSYVDSFVVSEIENGISLNVSSQDIIFTLPTFLLPKGVSKEKSYKFCIKKVNTKSENEEEINNINKQIAKEYKVSLPESLIGYNRNKK
ncbi:MAG: hypothetical protein MJ252_15410 [archaeon]|nr:hypothetical protein [archaeon]